MFKCLNNLKNILLAALFIIRFVMTKLRVQYDFLVKLESQGKNITAHKALKHSLPLMLMELSAIVTLH